MKLLVREFKALDVTLLYEILRLRSEIFVVEQACPYQDLDGLDKYAEHFVLCTDEGEPVSYCRLIPPRPGQPYAKLGRFVTRRSFRQQGFGERVLQAGIREAREKYPACELRLSGQLYLEKYYTARGFAAISEVYLEDNIPHKLFLYKDI